RVTSRLACSRPSLVGASRCSRTRTATSGCRSLHRSSARSLARRRTSTSSRATTRSVATTTSPSKR
uniref:Uncharacterized protein n=1 Tax=Globisporangium ultimum (strain ATCC 200006 / CBS 805.95 / DAOM BR144) TaxID=431595 RepID=K3WHP3_GLOUD